MENEEVNRIFNARKNVLDICRKILKSEYDLRKGCEDIYDYWLSAYFPLDENYYFFTNITPQINDYYDNYTNSESTSEEIEKVDLEIIDYVNSSIESIKFACQDLIDKYSI